LGFAHIPLNMSGCSEAVALQLTSRQ